MNSYQIKKYLNIALLDNKLLPAPTLLGGASILIINAVTLFGAAITSMFNARGRK